MAFTVKQISSLKPKEKIYEARAKTGGQYITIRHSDAVTIFGMVLSIEFSLYGVLIWNLILWGWEWWESTGNCGNGVIRNSLTREYYRVSKNTY